MNTVYTAQRWY